MIIKKFNKQFYPQYNKANLINPKEMIEICNKILADTEVNMRHRIEWYKRLSEEGYYLTYNFE